MRNVKYRRFKRNTRKRRGSRRSGGIKRIVRNILFNNTETKFNFGLFPESAIVSDAPPPNTTKTYAWFNGIVPGVSNGQRIGSRIFGRNIQYKLQFRFAPGPANDVNAYTYGVVRLVVMYPRKAVDGATLTGIALAANWNTTEPIDPTDVYVIKDEYIRLGLPNGGSLPCIYIKKFYNRVRLNINFAGTVVPRQPLLYLTSSIPQANSSKIYCIGHLRSSFKDI